MNDDIRQAYNDLDKFIAESGRGALLKLKLPTSFGIKAMSEDYEKGWIIGFRRCLAESQRLLRESEKSK